MMIDYKMARVWVALACIGGAGCLKADVKMPAIFGDHMVLQQNATLPVWGKADPGEKVSATVGSGTGSTTAGTDGKWLIKLSPLSPGDKPVTMTVTGKNTLTFTDVLIGDVWLCSGQSNMEFHLAEAANAQDALKTAKDPGLRFFHVQRKAMLTPQDDVTGKWEVCTPQSAATFTAVGYFFGRDLRSVYNRPIGLIESSWGGTPAQSWTSLPALKKDAVLDHYVQEYGKKVAAFPADSVTYPPAFAEFQKADAEWQKNVGVTFLPLLETWKKDAAIAVDTGKPIPPQPVPAQPRPKAPIDPNGDGGTPAALYNGMIAPLMPYAIKGVIWYQGESNASGIAGAEEYRTLFSRMITDWREGWGQGDLPFLFVHLARFGKYGSTDNSWAYLRESQFKTLALPNTGLASAVDIGDPARIHPQDKIDVGHRLALAARHVAYGESLVYSGPVFDAMKYEGNAIRVNFTQTGGGLIIGSAPWVPEVLKPIPTTSLAGFEVAGADRNWFPAEAKIDGASVVASSPQVAQPVAVRYAWNNAPAANLYNRENLPAEPFRTDDWQQVPPPKPVAPSATPSPSAPSK